MKHFLSVFLLLLLSSSNAQVAKPQLQQKQGYYLADSLTNKTKVTLYHRYENGLFSEKLDSIPKNSLSNHLKVYLTYITTSRKEEEITILYCSDVYAEIFFKGGFIETVVLVNGVFCHH